jgi:hypothetical protein
LGGFSSPMCWVIAFAPYSQAQDLDFPALASPATSDNLAVALAVLPGGRRAL